MKSRLSIWSCIITMCLTGPRLLAQTNVGGLICTDATWDVAGSPYVVIDDIVVACDATLTIDPGVQVRFKQGLGLTVGSDVDGAGTLIARGTVGALVLFTSNQPYEDPPVASAPGDWLRIHFTNDAIAAVFDGGVYQSGCILEYVTVEYASNGAITAAWSSPYLDWCYIHHNDGRGIYAYESAWLRVHNCEIWANGLGVNVKFRPYSEFLDNYIHDNSYGGLSFYDADGNTLTGNTITGNGLLTSGSGGGVRFGYRSGGNTLTGNTVTGNWATQAGGGVYFGGSLTNDNTLIDNTISDNTCTDADAANYGGGGIMFSYNHGNMLINNIISGNTITGSIGYGGGIYLWNAHDNTFVGNTIVTNTAEREGGGISVRGGYDNTFESNAIVENHTITGTTGGVHVAGNSSGVSFAGAPSAGMYNVIAGNDGYELNNDNAFDAGGTYDIDARYVCWRMDDTNAIEAEIYDYDDDPADLPPIHVPPAMRVGVQRPFPGVR